MWRMAVIRLGDALFHCPHRERTFKTFYHVSSHLWHWNMCGMSSAVFPYSLRHAGEGHDPLFAITFTLGGSLYDSLYSHLSCLEGTFFVANFSASQSTLVWDVSWSVYILCQKSGRGLFEIVLSIESLSSVQTLLPSSVFLFPSGAVGTPMKSLQFLSWMM